MRQIPMHFLCTSWFVIAASCLQRDGSDLLKHRKKKLIWKSSLFEAIIRRLCLGSILAIYRYCKSFFVQNIVNRVTLKLFIVNIWTTYYTYICIMLSIFSVTISHMTIYPTLIAATTIMQTFFNCISCFFRICHNKLISLLLIGPF